MTEDEWLSCRNPNAMITLLQGRGMLRNRKARLFAVACCRRMYEFWEPVEEYQQPVEIGEAYADSIATEPEREGAERVAREEADRQGSNVFFWEDYPEFAKYARAVAYTVARTEVWRAAPEVAEAVAYRVVRPLWEQVSRAGMLGYEPEHLKAQDNIEEAWNATNRAELQQQCHLLRDIFDNPFRPIAVERSWLAWNEQAVPKLARGIYDERAFGRLPALANTLEAAGCTNAEILAHCRGPAGMCAAAGWWIFCWRGFSCRVPTRMPRHQVQSRTRTPPLRRKTMATL